MPRTRTYINRHLQHEHYNFEYLGRNWNNPPTTAARKLLRATAPFVETGVHRAGDDAGAGRRRRGRARCAAAAGEPVAPGEAEPEASRRPPTPKPSWLRPGADVDRAPGAFLLVQTLGPLAVLAVPSTPIFGGVKHFMPAMPYLAVVAAIGLAGLRPALAGVCRAARARLQRARPWRWPRWCACPRWSRRGARTPTACRTTTCWRADSPAARRWG